MTSTLQVRGTELGVMRKGTFIAHTNFIFDVVASVEAPTGYTPCSGFVHSIKSGTSEGMEVFLSNFEASTPRTFVAAANRVIPSMQYVRMSETMWHRYIFQTCKSFTESAAYRKMILATCLGRQPGGDVWVLNEYLQVSGLTGQPIPPEEHQYYWHPQYRNASRLVHIPFFQPENEVPEQEKRDAEEALRDSRSTASSSLGEIIAIGNLFSPDLVKECLPLVTSTLTKMSYRTHKSYATLLAFAKLLAESTCVVDPDEVVQFFTTKWAPEVLRLYHPSSNVISDYLTGLLSKIQQLEVYEVLRFLRPDVTREGRYKVVAIALTDTSSYYSPPDEDLLRMHIKKVGKTNVPIDFLRDTSTDTRVRPSANGKKKKCVVIPHVPSIPEELLQRLYQVAGVLSTGESRSRADEVQRRREQEEQRRREQEEQRRREQEELRRREHEEQCRREQEEQRRREQEEQHRREQEEQRRREQEEQRRRELEDENLAKQMKTALALLKPQPDKATCPLMVCKSKKARTWIACDNCDQWYHVKCVGLTAKKANSLTNWNCGLC